MNSSFQSLLLVTGSEDSSSNSFFGPVTFIILISLVLASVGLFRWRQERRRQRRRIHHACGMSLPHAPPRPGLPEEPTVTDQAHESEANDPA